MNGSSTSYLNRKVQHSSTPTCLVRVSHIVTKEDRPSIRKVRLRGYDIDNSLCAVGDVYRFLAEDIDDRKT